MDAIEIDRPAQRAPRPRPTEYAVPPLTPEFNAQLMAADYRERRAAKKACEAHLTDLRRHHRPLASLQFPEGVASIAGMRRALP